MAQAMVGTGAPPVELIHLRLAQAYGWMPPPLREDEVRLVDALRYLAVAGAYAQVGREQGWW